MHAGRGSTPSSRRDYPHAAPLQPEHEQHGLVALLLEFGDELVLAARDRAQPGEDGDVLLAAHLERHRRRVEAGADVDLPELLHAGVVVGGKGAVGEAAENQAAGGRERAAVVGIRHVHGLLDLAGERIGGGEVRFEALDLLVGAALPIAGLVAQLGPAREIDARRRGWNVEELGLPAVGRGQKLLPPDGPGHIFLVGSSGIGVAAPA